MIERGKVEKGAARSARLSAALRENLKRRKAQARRRAAGAAAVAQQGGPARDGPDQPAVDKDSLAKDAEMGSAAPDFRRNPGRE